MNYTWLPLFDRPMWEHVKVFLGYSPPSCLLYPPVLESPVVGVGLAWILFLVVWQWKESEQSTIMASDQASFLWFWTACNFWNWTSQKHDWKQHSENILIQYMYIYIYICIYVCMYVRNDVCMYVCMYVWMYVCMYESNDVCMNVCMYVCLFLCIVCMLCYVMLCYVMLCYAMLCYVCMYVCMYVYINVM